jgi:LEA14-like dessication related protein
MSIRWLLTAIAAMGLAACASPDYPEPPEVVLLSLVPTDVSLMEQKVAVSLRVRNPNNAAMKVEGLRYTIDIAGKTFAKGTSDAEATVPRLGEVEVDGVGRIATADLIRQVVGTTTATGLSYRLWGTLFLSSGGKLSFDNSGQFDFIPVLGGMQKSVSPVRQNPKPNHPESP